MSGRTRESLDAWLGALPIALHAEHGFWSREAPGRPWRARWRCRATGRRRRGACSTSSTARTPGAFVEEKTASLAWHYRRADPEHGAVQSKELRLHLDSAFSNAPVEVIVGEKVVEIRPHGVNKGIVVHEHVSRAPEGTCVVAMGDDRTDEDLFSALPEDAIAVHVGKGASRAQFRVPDVAAARALCSGRSSSDYFASVKRFDSPSRSNAASWHVKRRICCRCEAR